MELLLILTYVAIVTTIFKFFKIPLTKWTVPTAVLGGIVLLGLLITLMNYNHPYSSNARNYFIETPIVPNVKGLVIEVNVKPNVLVKKGDSLFKIDPTPYKSKLDSINARLKLARVEYQRQSILLKQNATSANRVDVALANLDSLKAELAIAQFELESTVVKAPTNGYVTQLFLRPGMMATAMPLRPVMIFVHEEERKYIGWFQQNSLLRLEPGANAEISFQGIPGKIFQARVEKVLPFLAEGQLQASGELVRANKALLKSKVPVIVNITDKEFANYIKLVPGGSSAEVAIYTHHFHHIAVMRKILLRMASWMNYLFPFH